MTIEVCFLLIFRGDGVTAECYCGTLLRLRQATGLKVPGFLRQGVVILGGDATPRTARYTCEWLGTIVPTVIPICLVRLRSTWRFTADADVKQAVMSWLHTLATNFFHTGMHVLVPRWDRCLKVSSHYVEV